jgi:membrane protein YdbS with pleckstrin-like domain
VNFMAFIVNALSALFGEGWKVWVSFAFAMLGLFVVILYLVFYNELVERSKGRSR